MSYNIKNYKYIYVDSLYAVNYLKNIDNFKNKKFISFNPSLILNKKLKISSIEHNSKSKDYTKLGLLTYKYSGKIYNSIMKFNNNSMLGIWLARYLISIQNVMYRASKIKEFINDEKCLLVKSKFLNKRKNSAINGDFFSYMERFKNCKVIEIQHHSDDLDRIGKDPQTKFWIRLKYESLTSILFRLISILSLSIKIIWPFRKVYFSHENSLLKRIAFKMFLRGYLPIKFPKDERGFLKNNKINSLTLQIYKNVEGILILYQKSVLGLAYTKDTKYFFENKFKKYISDFVASDQYWKTKFSNRLDSKITISLFGFPSTSMELAFSYYAKKNKIKTASFQHAISKEISKDILSIDSIYESNIVDYYFVYNKSTAIYSKHSRFHKAKDIVMGLPEDLKKGMRYKRKKILKKPPILYASTTLYSGNRGIISRAGASDVEKAKFELDLINNVLGKLKHRIEYKPYFSKRYTGDAIEVDQAKSKENIIVNMEEIDLRYIVKDTQLIITSRATSTIGWCIFSSKPVIYIENVDNRLNEEASKIFKETLFFFDVLDPIWKVKLFEFLNRDISVIESEWIDKQKSTGNLIFKFLGYHLDNKDYVAINKLI